MCSCGDVIFVKLIFFFFSHFFIPPLFFLSLFFPFPFLFLSHTGPNHINGDIQDPRHVRLNIGGASNVGSGLSGACAALITDAANPTTSIVQGSGVSTVVREGYGDGRTYTIEPAYNGFDDTGIIIYRLAELFTIANVGTFNAHTIPLAKISHDKDQQGVTLDTFIGPFFGQYRLYKVDGHLYTVHFDTNLGNLQVLGTTNQLNGTNARVYGTDDIVQGVLPLSSQVSDLKQGVAYNFRVRARTSDGWSSFSTNSAKQAPMQAPGPPTTTVAGYAAHVDEIQTITTVAKHVDEIQTITTSAINVDEIQTVTTFAPIGGDPVDGNFSLRYDDWSTQMDIQEVRFSSRNNPIEWGTFRLIFDDGALGSPLTTSNCMEINATKETVQGELASLASTPNVTVWRDLIAINEHGGSTIVYTFGFDDTSHTYGSDGQNNLAQHLLTVDYTGCYDMYGGDNLTTTVVDVSRGGVDIPHDAEASFVERQLAMLPNVRESFVTRSLADDQGGYMYSITLINLQRNVRSLSCETNDIFRAVAGAGCKVRTLLDGNQLGGFFTLTYGGQTTSSIQHDATANDMETALESLDKITSLTVTRTLVPDHEGGFTWTIQFVTNLGDLGIIGATSSLTGTSNNIKIMELQKGNWLNGFFTMSHGGKTTHPIPYDATADLLKEELTKLATVDHLAVTRNVEPDTQRGYTWTVTFLADTMRGDVPLLTGNTDSMTGVGRNVYVREQRKGSEAIGTDLHVSFNIPMDDGGSPITYYKIEYDTTSSFASGGLRAMTMNQPQALFHVQRLFLETSTSLSLETFRLEYNGVVTSSISGIADKYQLRNALEQLPGINAVNVVPEYDASDVRRLTSQSYTITFTSVDETEGVGSSTGSTVGSALRMLSSPESDHLADTMTSASGTRHHTSDVRVAGVDCTSCTYLRDLTMGAKYYVRTRACNLVGCSLPATMNSSIIPRQLPSAPNSAKLYVVSGTELEIFFNPPSNIGGAVVTSYLIEWDVTSSFNTNGVGLALGQTTVSGGAIAGSPPFSKVIGTSFPLNTSIPYYVRVAAANNVPAQQVSSTQTPPDNRRWETTTPLHATPTNRPPNPPDLVELSLLHGTGLRVLIKPPTRQGGVVVSRYKVERSTVSTFTPSTTSAEIVHLQSLHSLDVSGRYVYDIVGLNSGQVYYVRVSAYNGVVGTSVEGDNGDGTGYGAPRLSTPTFSIPQQTPSGPTSVRISTITKQATPIRHVDVQWMSPTSNGGAEITSYKVEWWTKLVEHEVQTIHVSNSVPADHNGTFLIKVGGRASQAIPWDCSAEDLRWYLMNIEDHGTFLLGDVKVTRATTGAPSYGYKWSVTFMDATKNPGNVQMLVADGSNLISQSNNIVVTVAEDRRGVRSDGVFEVQRISSSLSCDAGFFRLALAGSSWSPYLAHNATGQEVANAIETLSTSGTISVERKDATAALGSGSSYLYDWYVTFSSNIGDMPRLQLEVGEMPSGTWIPSSDCSMIVRGGDNEIDAVGVRTCAGCMTGETPWQYHVVSLSNQIRTYQIQQLVTGTEYYVSLKRVFF